MINQKQIRLTKLALALSIALAAAPTFAQNTTSAVGGRVSGADGSPASGATVSIVHAESGSVSRVTAGADGRYSARGLRVGGPYTITIEKGGVVEKFENVYLNLAETAQVDATLGKPMQVVTVTGQGQSAKFNKSSMGAGTNIGRAELNNMASIARSLADYARKDPRLSQTDKDRGEISAGGQNSRFNSITIDGVSISDTFGLESNGLPTNKQPISIDAIQSVQVNISNYDVTQKGYTGANINAVTKSGTNSWKGSVYQVFRDEQMVGDKVNVDGKTYVPAGAFTEKTTGLTIGGPLIKDKLFVFVSAEDSTSSRAQPTFGPLGSTFNNVGITQSAIAGAIKVAKDSYGIDIGTGDLSGAVPLTVEDRLVKLDWNINDDHRANLRWQKTDQLEPQFSGLSASGIALSSYLWSENKVIESLVGQWFADWTPNFSTELKISRRDSGRVNKTNSNLPSVGLSFQGALPAGTPAGVSANARFINFGTEVSRQFNALDTVTDDIYVGATWSHGKHEIKGGLDYNKNEMFNAFLQRVNGTYTFGCLNTAAGLTYEFNNQAPLTCTSTMSAAIAEQATLENFRRGRATNYQAQLPVAGVTLNETAAQWTLVNTGLFLQDTWAVSPRLNMTYGLRYDRSATNDRPKLNAKVAEAPVDAVPNANPALARATGGFGINNQVTIDGDDLIQPRFGFNYRMDTKRATQIRGGAGLFGGAALNVWLGNPFANPGVLTYNVGCSGTFAACSSAGGIFEPDPTKQKPINGATPAAAVDVLAPGISQPSVYKMNLGMDHELPWFGMVLGLEYLHTKVNTGLYFQNLNLGKATYSNGVDKRDMFWTPQGYKAECANDSGGFLTNNNANPALPQCAGFRSRALSNASFVNVIRVQETKKGGGNLGTVSLSSGRGKELNWQLAYTYTDATEVSNLSSSTSGSNWGARAIFNPNEDVAAKSSYMVRDRVNASMTWEKRFFGEYKTTFGAFYEGRTGKPYSWTFDNDMNGDDVRGNDLMYVPKAFGSGEVLFKGDTAGSRSNETRFWDIVNANPSLLSAAGGVVGRQGAFAPWTNSIDLRFTQEVPGLFKGNRGVFVLDIQNFGNMLHKRWGRINEVGFASAGGNARSFVDYAGMQDGKYVYRVRETNEDFVTKQTKGESQWAVQVTARYEF
ncbi:MAG: TonB-dependent receptor [Pseudomonadota bacterium]